LATSFAAGRWLAPTKVITKTVTVEVDKQTQDHEVDHGTDHHKETDTTQITRPDGAKETTTKVIDDTAYDTKTSQSDITEHDTTKDASKEVIRSSDKVTISALAAIDVKNLSGGPAYGASISKPVLGPLAVGIFGLTSGVVGCSVGLVF
jgi:hypothetical protein